MILVIDDDSAIRTSLSFMLKRLKYDVQAVSTPKEAIAVVRSVAPELILMDMNFSLTTSGDEGITLLKQVKIYKIFLLWRLIITILRQKTKQSLQIFRHFAQK